MLRSLRNNKAQSIMAEYSVVIALVMAVLMVMSAYVKRAMQARIHDARDYMVTEVRSRTAGYFNGDLYREYEPYYTNTVSEVTRSAVDETRLLPGVSSGIFEKEFNEMMTVVFNSETLPPKHYNLTTPVN